MPTIVPPTGPLDAKIVIIGEAPGAEEEACGLPFVGASGKLLNAILSHVGINRHECYITNVVKTRPSKNDFSTLYLDGEKRSSPSPLLTQSIADLHSELRRLRPNVLIPLGGEALRAIVNKRSIDSWRGSILSSPFGKVVGTYHPARILREYVKLPIFEHDLQRAKEESASPAIAELGLQLEIDPNFTRVISFLQGLLAQPRPISFDIETTTGDDKIPHVRCLGIADSPTHALCIPFFSSSRRTLDVKNTIYFGPTSGPEVNNHWSEEEELEILRLLDQLFLNPQIEKSAQNGQFDCQVLAKEFGFVVSNFRHDTMVQAYVMYAELPKGLDFLASLYTKVPYYSDYDASVDAELWHYNCLDCIVTFQIASQLHQDLKDRLVGNAGFSSLTFYENHYHPAMATMCGVSQRGVRIDTKVRDEVKAEYTKQMTSLEFLFRQKIGYDINLASPDQLIDLFYNKLKLAPQRNPKTKQLSSDENSVDKLAVKYPEHREMFSILLDWRERQKLITTYLNVRLLNDKLYTAFNVAGTVTGRCNSKKNIFEYGTNLQNIPIKTELGRVLRRMFIADDDFVLIKCDLSQAEFRLVCWFARINRLIEKYLTNPDFDVHKWVASLIFRKPEDQITKSERSTAKNGVYGGNYAMQPPRAAVTYKIPLAEATFVLSEYRRAIPEIPMWWLEVQRQLNATRTITNPFGRVRIFMDRLDDATFRDAYSHLPQSTVADIIHRAAIVSQFVLKQCDVVLQVHDELVFHCHKTTLEENLPKIKKIMEFPLMIDGVKEPLVIPAELSFGQNWLDQEKWKP